MDLAALAIALAVASAAPVPDPHPVDPGTDEPPRIYRCTDAEGNLTLQDDPCPTTPPKPRAAPQPKLKPERKAKTVAAPAAPAPAAPSRPPAIVSAPPPSRSAPPSRPRNDEWVRIAAINSRPEGGSKEMGTPELVWDSFIFALRASDRARALRCLISEAKASFESLGPEELKSRGDSYSRIVIRNDVGPRRIAGATRRNGRITWIFFERSVSGEWRIASM